MIETSIKMEPWNFYQNGNLLFSISLPSEWAPISIRMGKLLSGTDRTRAAISSLTPALETKMENRIMLNYNNYCIQTLPRSGYGFVSATRQLSYGWKTLGVQTIVVLAAAVLCKRNVELLHLKKEL